MSLLSSTRQLASCESRFMPITLVSTSVFGAMAAQMTMGAIYARGPLTPVMVSRSMRRPSTDLASSSRL